MFTQLQGWQFQAKPCTLMLQTLLRGHVMTGALMRRTNARTSAGQFQKSQFYILFLKLRSLVMEGMKVSI
jgi:hypothetical protein